MNDEYGNKPNNRKLKKLKIQKSFIIYQDNNIKMVWDLYIALLLIYSCMSTPAKIAFSYGEGIFSWQVSDNVIDSSFGLDIVLSFFSAIEDDDLKVIDDRYIIIKNYLCG